VTKKLTIALAGNPNAGKTTLFNAITGARQHIANYPGVTVEKKSGRVIHQGYDIEVVDLPGTYSLHRAQRPDHAFCHGTAALSCPHDSRASDSRLGKDVAVHEKGGNHHSGRLHCSVGDDDLSLTFTGRV
jgi:hypothetical protein